MRYADQTKTVICITFTRYSNDKGGKIFIGPKHDAKDRYTGLKEKNGEEIFEGDIVLCERDEKCPHEVVWVEDNGGTFFGGMPGFNLSGLTRNGGKGCAWSGNEEVIGNIYEHPHLLTNEK
jgi:uncharacterized phage protein (TIGR01671 family)